MPRQTQIREPSDWEDVAGIGPKRAERLRKDVGEYSEFKNRSSNYQKNRIAGAVSGNRRNLPQFAENAIAAASRRERSADVVDSSLVEEQQVDQRSARTRSKTTVREQNRRADRSELGFETMQSDPKDVDRAAERLTEEFDDPFEVPARELGETAREVIEERQGGGDRATAQPLIGAAGSRTVFVSQQPGDMFRQELEETTQRTDRATASPGEMADAFVEFVDRSVGLDPQPRRSADSPLFETPVAPQATDIGRRASGRFDRTHREPDISTEPIARDQQTGRFQVDPFDLTPGYEGAPTDGFENPFDGSNHRSGSSHHEERSNHGRY